MARRRGARGRSAPDAGRDRAGRGAPWRVPARPASPRRSSGLDRVEYDDRGAVCELLEVEVEEPRIGEAAHAGELLGAHLARLEVRLRGCERGPQRLVERLLEIVPAQEDQR